MQESQILTNLTSLISTSFVMLSSLLIGMTKRTIVNANATVMFSHNVFDLVLHAKTNDYIMNTHHIMVILGVLYYAFFMELNQEAKEYISWIFLAEFTSFFNALRYNLASTSYYIYAKALFGAVFLVIRGYSTFGVIQWVIHNRHNEHILAYSVISILYTLLNLIWGGMIINQCIHQRFVIGKMLGFHYRTRRIQSRI